MCGFKKIYSTWIILKAEKVKRSTWVGETIYLCNFLKWDLEVSSINWRLSRWAFTLYTFLVLKVQDILIIEWRMFLLPDDAVGLSSVEPTQTDKYRFQNTLCKLRRWGSAKDKVAQTGQNGPKWLWLLWAIEMAFSDSLLTFFKLRDSA